MATPKIADLIDEYNEIKGTLSFKPDYKKLCDKNVELVVFCDKQVGRSHFSLVRNHEFEIIFTHKVGEKIHQSKLDFNTFHPVFDTCLHLYWGPDNCEVRWDYTSGCCDAFAL